MLLEEESDQFGMISQLFFSPHHEGKASSKRNSHVPNDRHSEHLCSRCEKPLYNSNCYKPNPIVRAQSARDSHEESYKSAPEHHR